MRSFEFSYFDMKFYIFLFIKENLVIFINSHSSEKEIALFKIVSPLTKISKLKLLDGDWSKGLKELTVDVRYSVYSEFLLWWVQIDCITKSNQIQSMRL